MSSAYQEEKRKKQIESLKEEKGSELFNKGNNSLIFLENERKNLRCDELFSVKTYFTI